MSFLSIRARRNCGVVRLASIWLALNESDTTMLAIRLGSALLILTFTLSGCGTRITGAGGASTTSMNTKTPRQIPAGPLDFAWKLSGDRTVAPLQVFSDASHIWLQWLPNQTLPAIFAVTEAGEQIASYERVGPYAKLDGHWTTLIFRGAQLQAKARRIHAPSTALASSRPVSQTSSPAAIVTPAPKNAQPFYAITSSDKNLRQALARWSGLSGWRFQAEHWAVDVDIPLTATANFSDDFIGSVRALVEATELSERPLQPCFYANQVLRVVPINEVCDRTVVEGARV